MKNIKVYDNGGRSIDRFTVFYRDNPATPWGEYLALSDNPESPQGFSQCGALHEPLNSGVNKPGHDTVVKGLGQLIEFEALPPNVQQHVRRRLSEAA